MTRETHDPNEPGGDAASAIRPETPVALLGRDSECEALRRLIEDVRRGESRSLVLRGEAGIGKTALLRYLTMVAGDVTVCRAAGVESEMELTFASLHQLCGPMLNRLPGLPGPQRQALEIVFARSAGPPPDRFLVGLAVLSLFSQTAEDRPLLCVVDDAQWLDRASAQTLAFVSRRLLAEPIGVVFATRHASEELAHLPQLDVAGLRLEDARELLARGVPPSLDARVRERIIAETRGNPLALMELPRGLSANELEADFAFAGGLDLSGHIEGSFLRRIDKLSPDGRRLVLLAAAEPLGDSQLVWRAAEQMGITRIVAEEPQAQELLEIDETGVRFSHPLARSAVYSAASAPERRAAHLALAEVTDREADPERRAWHLASAAAGPDEQVAAELERSAGRAQARGGVAAAAAFLTRSVALSEDAARRGDRAIAAAQACLHGGAFDAALGLLTTAEGGSLDELQRARVNLLRAQITFVSRRDATAIPLLLGAARQLEALDARLARTAYVGALSGVLFAARYAPPDGRVRAVAGAIRSASFAGDPAPVTDLLLEAWATLFVEGGAAAVPALREAVTRMEVMDPTAEDLPLLWLVTISAPAVWDDAVWEAASEMAVDAARRSAALSELSLALRTRAYVKLLKGDLDAADALVEEARAAAEATGGETATYSGLTLTALRGGEQEAATMLELARGEAVRRGAGGGLTAIAWAQAIVANGHGNPSSALDAAREACACPTNNPIVGWSLVELVEAAARAGEQAEAAAAAERLRPIARSAGTDWALGVDARCRALLTRGDEAEALFREAVERLGRTRMGLDLARAHLLYGEWLRREQRRVDARTHLREAHAAFSAMGITGFTERAAKELLATGERMRRRTTGTRDELTPQERQIARLARDGLSNPEIGARLFLSPRTVEWHLRKVFTKLDVRSRRELAAALTSLAPDAEPPVPR